MRNYINIIIVSLLFIGDLFAQSPEGFNYQAVVRNSAGEVVSDQSVGIRMSLIQSSANGTTVYQETFNQTTNTFGLVNLVIGSGAVVSGDFSVIDWTNGPYFLEMALDVNGGRNYVIMGTSQLMSVPFALYAKSSGSSIPGPEGPQGLMGERGLIGETGPTGPQGDSGPKGDTGPAGEQGVQGKQGEVGPSGKNGVDGIGAPQTISQNGNEITLSDNGGTVTIIDTNTQLTEAEVDAFVANDNYLTSFTEVDGDVTNELQDISLTGNNLSISDGSTIDLSAIDTDTNTQLTEAEVDAFVANDNYLTSFTEVDGDVTNELQDISLSGNNLSISDGSTIDLSAIDTDTNTQLTEAEVDAFVANDNYLTSFTEVDGDVTNELQDISLSGNNLSISDGSTIDLSAINTDTNTQLTEAEVDAFVANDNYLTSFTEVDGDVTNELQDISLTGNNLSISDGSTIDLSAINTDTNTQLTEAEVDAFVANDNYLTSFTEVDGDVTNELQDISLTGNNLSISDGSTIDLSAIDTDTNTQLTEAEVDAFVANDNYLTSFTEVDGDATNELQDISLSGNNLSISDGSTIDLSAIDTDTNTQLTEAEVDAFVANDNYLTSFTEVDGDVTNELQDISLSGNNLSISDGSTIDLSAINTDTNTQLTEAEVDAFVANDNYLTSFTEVDGDPTNELQDISLSGNNLSISDGSTIDLSGIDTDTNTQLTEAEVDAFVANDNYLTSFTELDGDPTNEIQDLTLNDFQFSITGGSTTITFDPSASNEIQDISLSGNNLSISDGSTIDLSAINTDTNTQLTEAEVDAFVANDNYLTSFTEVDGDPTNEIQNLDEVLSESNDAGGAGISNLADPISSQDAATKAYVDALENTVATLTAAVNTLIAKVGVLEGISPSNQVQNGLSARELLDEGYTVEDLLNDGLTPQELLDAEITPLELLNANISPVLTTDDIIGLSYEGGLIYSLDENDGSGKVVTASDQSQSIDWAAAVMLADNATIGGFNDWALPTVNEYLNISLELDENGFGNFAQNPNFYWSEEIDGTLAWVHYFDNTFGDSQFDKTETHHVRLSRVFGSSIDILAESGESLQEMLDGGITPLQIYTGDNSALSQLYGLTFDGETIANPQLIAAGLTVTQLFVGGTATLQELLNDGFINELTDAYTTAELLNNTDVANLALYQATPGASIDNMVAVRGEAEVLQDLLAGSITPLVIYNTNNTYLDDLYGLTYSSETISNPQLIASGLTVSQLFDGGTATLQELLNDGFLDEMTGAFTAAQLLSTNATIINIYEATPGESIDDLVAVSGAPTVLQALLTGNISPLEIFNTNNAYLDDLYGLTYSSETISHSQLIADGLTVVQLIDGNTATHNELYLAGYLNELTAAYTLDQLYTPTTAATVLEYYNATPGYALDALVTKHGDVDVVLQELLTDNIAPLEIFTTNNNYLDDMVGKTHLSKTLNYTQLVFVGFTVTDLKTHGGASFQDLVDAGLLNQLTANYTLAELYTEGITVSIVDFYEADPGYTVAELIAQRGEATTLQAMLTDGYTPKQLFEIENNYLTDIVGLSYNNTAIKVSTLIDDGFNTVTEIIDAGISDFATVLALGYLDELTAAYPEIINSGYDGSTALELYQATPGFTLAEILDERLTGTAGPDYTDVLAPLTANGVNPIDIYNEDNTTLEALHAYTALGSTYDNDYWLSNGVTIKQIIDGSSHTLSSIYGLGYLNELTAAYELSELGFEITVSNSELFLANPGYSISELVTENSYSSISVISDLILEGIHPYEIYLENNAYLTDFYGVTYEGGNIFYMDVTDGSVMVASLTNLGNVAWWDCSGDVNGNANGVSIGDGISNTTAIINECATAGYAATLSRAFDDGTSWSLPSTAELTLMYNNLNGATLYGGENFLNDYYWTSTNNGGGGRAFAIQFGNGSSSNEQKEDLNQVRAVKTVGTTTAGLISSGINAQELIDASSTTLAEVIAAGADLSELLPPNNTMAELNAANATAQNLFDAGATVSQMIEIGALEVLVQSPHNISIAQLYQAGVSVTNFLDVDGYFTIDDLVMSGISVSDILAANHAEATVALLFAAASVSLSDLVDAGADLEDLLSAGATIANLLVAGVSEADLYDPGFATIANLKAAGADLDKLLATGASYTELLGSYTTTEIYNAGGTISALVTENPANLVSDLITAGVSIETLAGAGASVADLKTAEATLRQLIDGGASVASLLANSNFTLVQLIGEAVPMADLVAGGATVASLIGCGADIGELIALGADMQQLLDNGATPKAIYDHDNSALSSLYGLTYQGGLIYDFNTTDGTGKVLSVADQGAATDWNAAVLLADNSTLGGYDDWSLPSANEYTSIALTLHLNGLGTFLIELPNAYWSEEVDATDAYVNIFETGVNFHLSQFEKTESYLVRLSRSF